MVRCSQDNIHTFQENDLFWYYLTNTIKSFKNPRDWFNRRSIPTLGLPDEGRAYASD